MTELTVRHAETTDQELIFTFNDKPVVFKNEMTITEVRELVRQNIPPDATKITIYANPYNNAQDNLAEIIYKEFNKKLGNKSE